MPEHDSLEAARQREAWLLAALRAVLHEVGDRNNTAPEKASCVSVPYLFEVVTRHLKIHAEMVAAAPAKYQFPTL